MIKPDYTEFSTDSIIIEDAITLISNMAAHGPSGLEVVEDEAAGVLYVSFSVFQWSLHVHVAIKRDSEQAARMRTAIRHNIDVLIPAIDEFNRADLALSEALFYDSDAIKSAYNKALASGQAPANGFEDFKAQALEPLQNWFNKARAAVYHGDISQHPNKYLQSIGVKQLRLEAVSPLYR